MTRRLLALLLLAGPSACASAGSPGGGLAYRVPEPAAVTYRVSDTARVEIDAGGQSFGLTAGSLARWRMEFTPADGGARVTATLVELDARLSNPLMPPQTADQSAVRGPVVFVLDRRGDATVVSLPEVAQEAIQFVNGAGIAHSFFPGLPGRPVASGESWTDTVAYTSEEGGASSTVRTVLTFTAAGDTLVAGRAYRRVHADGTARQETSGSIGGMAFDQRLEGRLEGQFLWDDAAGLLHSLDYRSDLTGRMEIDAAPFPLDVRLRGNTRVSRAGT